MAVVHGGAPSSHCCPADRRGVLVSPALTGAPMTSSLSTRSLVVGAVVKPLRNGSHSKMKLNSGFWSYTVGTETEMCGRKARVGIPEDPRTKDPSKLDH